MNDEVIRRLNIMIIIVNLYKFLQLSIIVHNMSSIIVLQNAGFYSAKNNSNNKCMHTNRIQVPPNSISIDAD